MKKYQLYQCPEWAAAACEVRVNQCNDNDNDNENNLFNSIQILLNTFKTQKFPILETLEVSELTDWPRATK